MKITKSAIEVSFPASCIRMIYVNLLWRQEIEAEGNPTKGIVERILF